MNTIPRSLLLKAGEPVEVRSREEILSTLDKNGCLDGLPFMPEMFEFCGKRLRVYKRAHKTCDTFQGTSSRRLTHAVHLEGLRCNGEAHGGCQADCLIFWKEAWLKRVAPSMIDTSPVSNASSASCTEADVLANTRKAPGAMTDEPVYVCQATRLLHASAPLPWWDLRQYWEDFASGNFGVPWMLGVLGYGSYDVLMRLGGRIRGGRRVLRWVYNAVQKLRGKPAHPRTWGRIPAGARTPAETLNLQPGEMVRVKSFDAILDTIDREYRNRGMRWDAEMVPYCGGVYRVRKRVRQIIDEKTGRMLHLKSEPVVLEGVTCQSKYSEGRYFCPRSIYPYWHEIWLERLAQQSPRAPK